MIRGARQAATLVAGLAVCALSADAHAQLHSWVYGGDVSGGLLLSEPQATLYGPGGSLSLEGYKSYRPRLMVGLRLRTGLFTDGKAPNVARANPGLGGMGALLATVRYRPWGRDRAARPFDRMSGWWVDGGLGGGVTGSLVRPMGEVGFGYGWLFGRTAVSPALRYFHILQPGAARPGQDAMMLLAGVEALWGTVPAAPPPEEPEPPEEGEAPAKGADQDGDGIPDATDKCPTAPEDRDGFEDEDGCPDLDNDRDGIPDDRDACPMQAEVINGVNDTDGCPDQGVITMVDDRVVLEEHVLFETDRARVSTQGRAALVAVMRLWSQHPEWQRLDVEGHADERGSDAYNQWLSEERAARVRKVFVDLGLSADKVTARGFGKTRPRAQGRDEESLRLNRRVELVVIRNANAAPAVPTAPPSGHGFAPPALPGPSGHWPTGQMPLSPPPADGGGFAPSLPMAPPPPTAGPPPAVIAPSPSKPPPRRARPPSTLVPEDERR
jgi:outer membrane protein OmpA-like peptidoglycan-associated protein